MRIFSNFFKGRDAPVNRTSGSAYSFFMGGSTSGKRVNERTAMQMTAVYSCVRILSEAVAGLPLQFYRYTADGGKEKAVDHPLYFLLHDEPNPEMTSFVFRETLMTHLLLWGNAYSQIIRNARGEIIALYPLMPDRMTVNRDENGQLYHEYYMNTDDAHELFDYPPYIDVDSIRGFMKNLSYPLYFLDFESFQPAILLFDNSRPYEQIVFQYSLHYVEHEGGELKHTEFLAYPGSDPRRALAEQLCADIPLDVCTTAYSMGFEKGRIRGLAELYPDLREHLMNIHDHIQDLMIPFQKKWYYCCAMQGSYSIKYVLPALFPDDPTLDYHNLDGVHNGGEASEMFAKMATMQPKELETARGQLLKYCGLDTFAMVKVWEKLKEI